MFLKRDFVITAYVSSTTFVFVVGFVVQKNNVYGLAKMASCARLIESLYVTLFGARVLGGYLKAMHILPPTHKAQTAYVYAPSFMDFMSTTDYALAAFAAVLSVFEYGAALTPGATNVSATAVSGIMLVFALVHAYLVGDAFNMYPVYKTSD